MLKEKQNSIIHKQLFLALRQNLSLKIHREKLFSTSFQQNLTRSLTKLLFKSFIFCSYQRKNLSLKFLIVTFNVFDTIVLFV